MIYRMIKGLFDDIDAASTALEALMNANFKPDQVSVLGNDMGELRMMDIPVRNEPPDRFVIVAGTVGAIIGALAGPILAIASNATNAIALTTLGAFFGAAAGLSLGMVMGAILHFDIPEFKSRVVETHLKKGKVMIVVFAENHDETVKAEAVLDEFGATEIWATLSPSVHPEKPESHRTSFVLPHHKVNVP
ncbi:MAG TPA: hypothetical protein V6D17_06045 [Candidatus Obscuribacterales bacterium]